jgi:hypothetical protein
VKASSEPIHLGWGEGWAVRKVDNPSSKTAFIQDFMYGAYKTMLERHCNLGGAMQVAHKCH